MAAPTEPMPIKHLAYVSMCDEDGRGSPSERLGKGDPVFLHTMYIHEELGKPSSKIQPVLMGRHLIEAGYKPGKEFGPILEKAYQYQLDTGCDSIEELLEAGRNG